MKLILLSIVVLCIINGIVEAHRRNRNNKRRLWQRHQRRFENNFADSFHHVDSEVAACYFKNSKITEKRDCPGDYNCTAGEFDVEFGNETGIYKFCNIPLREEHACKIVHANSGQVIKDQQCPENVACEAGPITHSSFWSMYDPYELYFCGYSLPPLPTRDVYERLLTAKSCSVNGLITSTCSWSRTWRFWWFLYAECSGITLTLRTMNGLNSTLRFCKDQDDPDFSYIKLWGTPWCKGHMWDPSITTTVNDHTKNSTIVTDSPESDHTTDASNGTSRSENKVTPNSEGVNNLTTGSGIVDEIVGVTEDRSENENLDGEGSNEGTNGESDSETNLVTLPESTLDNAIISS